MSALPPGKVPRMNTLGERYRDIQIILQLPKQDLSDAYSSYNTDQERLDFDEFRRTRDTIAMDIGYVRPLPDASVCVLLYSFGILNHVAHVFINN